MLSRLRRLPRLLLRTAPQLIAWYLAGEVVREGILAIAAPIGPESALAALLLVPIAVLARLVSYVGMFLVLRNELPAFRNLAGGKGVRDLEAERRPFRAAVRDFGDLLIASIVPFFTLYALIGGLQDDLSAYAQAAYGYSFGADGDGLTLANDGGLVAVVVVSAFALRVLINRLGSRLPKWVTLASIYLEATWVFVAVSGIQVAFAGAYEWVMSRNIVTWYLGLKEAVREGWDGFRFAIDGFDALLPVLIQLVLLPLAWLLIGGVIYTRALAGVADRRIVPRRVEAAVRARLARTPRLVRHQARIVAEGWDELGRPLITASRMILHAGLVPLAGFMLAYAVVYAAGQWLELAGHRLVGPHDSAFWDVWGGLLYLGVAVIIEPIRIAVIGSSFDAALAKWRVRADASDRRASDAITTGPESSPERTADPVR